MGRVQSCDAIIMEADENLARSEIKGAARVLSVASREGAWKRKKSSVQKMDETKKLSKRGRAEGRATNRPEFGRFTDLRKDGRRKGDQHKPKFAATVAALTGEHKSTINKKLAALGIAADGARVYAGFSRLIIRVGVRNLRTPGVLVRPMSRFRMQRLVGLLPATGELRRCMRSCTRRPR